MNRLPVEPETLRLQTVARYGVLDTPPEAPFERITRLVTALLNVPIAAVTLVDRNRQWFKSQIGLGVAETPRDQSFCAHAMLGMGPLVVRDARLDDRFAYNPLVTGGPNIRFYVGMPLPDDASLGEVTSNVPVPRAAWPRLAKRPVFALRKRNNPAADTEDIGTPQRARGHSSYPR